ncbi:ThuA domain-containing protein [Akkermansiaceae bacterium]|nr:ThuA domain-containing protein [Akkermansiaceae bacterium]MDB4537762.1 ThuA domain-containing protein [Akkermansiaceae bacterium]
MRIRSCLAIFILAVLPVSAKPKILALIAEREYETRDTLPVFFEKHLKDDYEIAIIQLEDDKHDFAGLEKHLEDTELLFISVRRRTPTTSQMTALRNYIQSGKPVLGIRTSSHAFATNKKQQIPAGHANWQSWDADVFGGSYSGHLKREQATTAMVFSEHEITKGLPKKSFSTGGSLYTVKPLAQTTTVYLSGSAKGSKDDQPVAWSFRRKDGGLSFYTSLGHVKDFESTQFPRLLKQATKWLLNPSPRKGK